MVEASIVNTKNGPIYIGAGAEVMEGCLIRGPFALGERAQLKMGAKVYGPTAIGPDCRIGGEVSNSVILGFSNKAHDGFLGNSVLGEWCNLGADTNNSNLKNTYGEVNVWSYAEERVHRLRDPVLRPDHGRSQQERHQYHVQYGDGRGRLRERLRGRFPRQACPELQLGWGGRLRGICDTRKAIAIARRVMERRNIRFSADDEAILAPVFEASKALRD